ncbi:hypothetical protein [Amycolatopsis sp. WAC 01375]|uniref:hypothetical protein n=1 Tax=Amycolatopsis sp. WAC 01375 TaxID=2203194 RepID=UPI0018F766FE|nr:hypothetical protein [Amycolatopsis sp. WAC 01375]
MPLAATLLLLVAQVLLPGLLYLCMVSELADIVEIGPFMGALFVLIVPLMAATLLIIGASRVSKLGDSLADVAAVIPSTWHC